MAKKVTVGKVVPIVAGKRVRVYDSFGTYTTNQSKSTLVTVRAVQRARAGKVRIFWKRNGYKASALV